MKQTFLMLIIASFLLSSCANPNKQYGQNDESIMDSNNNSVQKSFWDCSFGNSWEEVINKLSKEGFKNVDINRNHSLIAIENMSFNGSLFDYATFFFDSNDKFNLISFHSTYDNYKEANESFDNIKDKYPFKLVQSDDKYKFRYEYSDGDNTCEFFVYDNNDSTYLAKLMYKNNKLNN